MSVEKVIGVVSLVIAAITTGCAADSSDDKTDQTSKSRSQLEDGLGNDIPMPRLPGGDDEPWNDPDWKPPVPGDRDHDPIGPEGDCELDWVPIFDPVRGKNVDVPVVSCS